MRLVLAISLAASVIVYAQAIDQTATAVIIKADTDFNQAVADRDVTRFLSLIAETATFNGGTPGELRGHEAIAKD